MIASTIATQTADRLARRKQVMPTSYRTFYSLPVDVKTADGVWITDTEGKCYLDAYNNVPVIGHSHPLVRERVSQALSVANPHTRYLSEPVIAYAQRLIALFPASLDKVVFTNSGSEANDLALQISRFVTGNEGVIITSHAYHGTTSATHAVSPSLSLHLTDSRIAHVTVPAPGTPDFTQAFRSEIRAAVARLHANGHRLAAGLFDSTLTSDGIFTHPAGFLAGAFDEVRKSGGLAIADEVQSGFARTGLWWGFERHGFIPDLATLGKPMGNGLPISAVIGSGELLDSYGDRFRYFNTFAGSPAVIAAASAVLDVIHEDDLLVRTEQHGRKLRRDLEDLIRSQSLDAAVRGDGLMTGIDLAASGISAGHVADRLRDSGVLVGTTGVTGEVLKIRPPLAVQEDHLSMLVARLDQVLQEAQR